MQTWNKSTFTVIVLFLTLFLLSLSLGVALRTAVPVLVKSSVICIVAGLICIVSPIIRQHNLTNAIDRLHREGYWCHWTYPLTVWRTEAPKEWMGIPLQYDDAFGKKLMLLNTVAGVVAGILGYVWASQEGQSVQTWQTSIASGVGVLLACSIFSLLFYRQQQDIPLPDTVDLYMGAYGVHIAVPQAQFIPFQLPGVTILETHVIVDEQPRFAITMKYDTGNEIRSTLTLPIPFDRIEEAQIIAARFHT